MAISSIIIVISGLYSIIALWLSTENLRSALLFKIIPFFIGLSIAQQEGWVLNI